MSRKVLLILPLLCRSIYQWESCSLTRHPTSPSHAYIVSPAQMAHGLAPGFTDLSM